MGHSAPRLPTPCAVVLKGALTRSGFVRDGCVMMYNVSPLTLLTTPRIGWTARSTSPHQITLTSSRGRERREGDRTPSRDARGPTERVRESPRRPERARSHISLGLGSELRPRRHGDPSRDHAPCQRNPAIPTRSGVPALPRAAAGFTPHRAHGARPAPAPQSQTETRKRGTEHSITVHSNASPVTAHASRSPGCGRGPAYCTGTHTLIDHYSYIIYPKRTRMRDALANRATSVREQRATT